MHNNLKNDSANPWRNICDGKFQTTTTNAILKSPRINIDFKHVSGDQYELKWSDNRYKFPGVFNLTKTK